MILTIKIVDFELFIFHLMSKVPLSCFFTFKLSGKKKRYDLGKFLGFGMILLFFFIFPGLFEGINMFI